MVCTYRMYIWYVHIKRAKITVTCHCYGPQGGDFVSCDMEKSSCQFREEPVHGFRKLFCFFLDLLGLLGLLGLFSSTCLVVILNEGVY